MPVREPKKKSYRSYLKRSVSGIYHGDTPGPDWFNPSPEFLNENGQPKGELALVASHLCFKPKSCPLVRDTDRVVLQDLRSKNASRPIATSQ